MELLKTEKKYLGKENNKRKYHRSYYQLLTIADEKAKKIGFENAMEYWDFHVEKMKKKGIDINDVINEYNGILKTINNRRILQEENKNDDLSKIIDKMLIKMKKENEIIIKFKQYIKNNTDQDIVTPILWYVETGSNPNGTIIEWE